MRNPMQAAITGVQLQLMEALIFSYWITAAFALIGIQRMPPFSA